MDPLTEEFFVSGNPNVEEQTKEETENNAEKPVNQLDKQKTDISTDPEPVNPLLEVKKVLNAINALPKGVFPNIEKFIQEDFSFHTVQREATTNSQTGEEIAPALTLHALITLLETALRNIQASNYT